MINTSVVFHFNQFGLNCNKLLQALIKDRFTLQNLQNEHFNLPLGHRNIKSVKGNEKNNWGNFTPI